MRTARARTFVAVGIALAAIAPGAFAQPQRPQTPTEPYPYTSEDVTINASDAMLDEARWVAELDEYTHTLGATITIPDADVHGAGPYPGVVLMSGSGPQNRDSELVGHKVFLVVSDYLTRRGIAVLRFDDRGTGESTGSFAETEIRGHAMDAFFAARALMAHPDVDASRVGLVGHSQGGTLAPLVAQRDPDIAFLVLLAGTGASGADVLYDQTEIIYRQTRFEDGFVDDALARRAALFDRMCNGADDEELFELVTDIAQAEFRAPDREAAAKIAESLAPQFLGTFMRSFVCYDPIGSYEGLTRPVLAMNGSLDTQVTPRVNLDPIRDALDDAGNTHATIVELSGLNHLFQEAKTGAVGEYMTIEQTMSPRALSLIGSWIVSTCEALDLDEE